MNKTLTCILCPNGCTLSVVITDGRAVSVTGARCPRGKPYAVQEALCPMRTFSTSVKVQKGTEPLASVRLSGPIPLERLMEAMDVIRGLSVEAPVHSGQVVLDDILGLGIAVLATRDVDREK